MIPRAISHRVLGWAIRGVGAMNRIRFSGSTYECPICRSGLRAFLPLPALFRTELHVSGRRYTERDFETLAVDEYMCPVCRAADRDRLVALYFRGSEAEGPRDGVLLHFAPERSLSGFLRRSSAHRYRTADLYMPGVDERVDITRMDRIPDGSVACFVCSHVLEHVPADTAAMAELFRILTPGGWGIVMSPILRGLERTREDASIVAPEQRRKHFGQDDHVRVYAKGDFVRRLEGVGFAVGQLGVEFFGADVFRRAGIDLGSCLYVVRKGVAPGMERAQR